MTTKKELTSTKKDLKRQINANGFFAQMELKREVNAPQEYADQIPEGATYFEGIASNGELNRNGYIIREKAWKDAIEGYFVNPVILLQHWTDCPIGKALSAKITKDGLWVSGYIYDDETEGKFGRGLLNALSTGHYTLGFEFENTKTGKILTEEEFRGLTFEEQMSNDWVLAVTKLEWVEFSLVTIGSNRKSVITRKNAIMNHLDIKQEALNGTQEVNTPEVLEDAEKEQTTEETNDGSETSTDQDTTQEKTEVAEGGETNTDADTGETSEEVETEPKTETEKNTAQSPAKEGAERTQKVQEVLENESKSETSEEAKETETNELDHHDLMLNAIKSKLGDSELQYFENLLSLSQDLRETVAVLASEKNALSLELNKIKESSSKKAVIFSTSETNHSSKPKEGEAIRKLFAASNIHI